MFITSNQLAASIRNANRDRAFWSNPEKVAKWEQEVAEYENFCKKYGEMD